MEKSKLNLYIKSAGKSDKSFSIEKEGKKEEVEVKKDILEELKKYLKKNNLNLKQFDDFIPIPTKSFTGYRMAVNICNVLKHYVKSVPIENLEYPKYHKEPNITYSDKNS